MIVDLFLIYQFIKRLATPFKEWKAYELGIIDENGNQLKKRRELTTQEEKKSFGIFDLMITKLKRLIEKIPGGKSRIGTYAAALYLIKEHSEIRSWDEEYLTEECLSDDHLESKLNEYIEIVKQTKGDYDLDSMFDMAFSEDAPANSASSGNVAGIGIGPDGEPGVSKKEQEKIRKNNKYLLKRNLQTGVRSDGAQ